MQLSDSGVYTCVARSRAGLAELSYDVQVQGTVITHHLLIYLGSDAVCVISDLSFFCVYDLQCPLVWIMSNQWSQLQLSRDPW